MIISVTKERYDAYWEDFEKTSYYWVTNPKVVRQITRLETKVETLSHRAIVMYNMLRAVKYIIIPLMLFIISLALGGHAQRWILGGVAGLVFFGITYVFDWANWVDGYGGPGDGSSRRRRLLRKAARIGSKTKDSDRIPVSWALGHLYDNPEMRSIMLEHSGEITRRLIESEAVEMRKLLALPKEELSPEKRSELRYKIDVIEDDIVSMVKEEAAVRKSTEAEEAEMRNIEAAEAAEARRAGNDLHANLLLRKIK